MPSIRNVGGRIRYSIERFDGGKNSKDSPANISPFETPDCLNVVFSTRGSAETRDGTKKFNTTPISGSNTVDGGINYNQTMVVWSNGQMFYADTSTTTFVPVTTSSGKFKTGSPVAATVYQNILFCSDGTNGPWKWTGGENFYNMGIVTPSAAIATQTSAGSIATGTYYYAVSFMNSQAVEGGIGSAVTVSLTSSSTVGLTSIPVGSSLAGVNARRIYRADNISGPYRRVGEIDDNTTTTFADTTANGAEGAFNILDASQPTPFTTICQHHDRLFFDDSTNRSLMRYTDFTNPFVSEALNFEPIDQGDGELILAICSQDDTLTVFKYNNNTAFILQDPSDDTTWIKQKSPSNLGIVGPRAFTYMENGVVFIGRQNNRLTGLHFLTGIQVVETFDGKLRAQTISPKIEYDLLNLIDSTAWPNMALATFQNRLYMAHAQTGNSVNNRIWWLDLGRVMPPYEPGSWAPWDGIHAACLFTWNNQLYFGDSQATGFVRQFNAGAYNDDGAAINSYFWTKEIGGEDEGELDSYKKDLREIYVWFQHLGNYNMNVRYRVDGDTSNGTATTVNVSLAPGGTVWGTMVWGVDPWGGTVSDTEVRIPIGGVVGKRFQVRFDNQNTANQGFKVHRIELGMNLRRRR